jgi:3-hydroxyisobutyrate dehydrogenase-like beta-hydroxyacid dehydrogenase
MQRSLAVHRSLTSRAAFLEFLNDSVLGSTFSRCKSPALVNLDFTPTFTMTMLLKDFDLGMAASRSLGVPMPVAAAARNPGTGAAGPAPGPGARWPRRARTATVPPRMRRPRYEA